jgi:hypothetical protein
MDQFSNHPLCRKHDIDSAMSSIWDFYKHRFLSLFLISLVMSLVLQYASTFANLNDITTSTDPMVMLGMLKDVMVPILIISLINLFFNVILQYYIIYNPINKENNIIVSLLKSLKYFIPYLIIIILLSFVGSIAIVLGILALVIGVFFSILYIMTLYLFILPVMMMEGPGIGNTITRTVRLAHSNFWSNMGWVAVFIIVLIVASLLLSGIILLPFTGNLIKTIVNPGEASQVINMTKNPLFIILSAIAGSLTFPLMPLFSCVLYFNGKMREEINQQPVSADPENTRVRVEDLYAKPYSDDHPDNPDNKV